MPRPSNPSRLALMLLSATLISLTGCSHLPSRPGPLPQVIQCQPPVISPELMTPPQVQAINRLLKRLGLPPVNVVRPSNTSPLSR